jgi:hypothetical protein
LSVRPGKGAGRRRFVYWDVIERPGTSRCGPFVYLLAASGFAWEPSMPT